MSPAIRTRQRRPARIVTAILVTAVLTGGGPPLAAAVFDAVNADKVDGRHAVAAGATVAQRAGKLVATNSNGRLPNGIITKAGDADRLDGLSSAAFQRRITGACEPPLKMTAVGAGGGVTCGVDRIDGGRALTLDGKPLTDFQRGPSRTILVVHGDSPAISGSRLVAAMSTPPTSGANQPSGSKRWTLLLEPGTYELAEPLLMRSFVDLRGAGAGTVITCACPPENDIVITTVAGSQLQDLRIVNDGEEPVGVFAPGHGATLTNVEVSVAGADLLGGTGILGESVDLRDSRIDVDPGYGVTLTDGSATITDSVISGTLGWGLRFDSPANLRLTRSSVRAAGPETHSLIVRTGTALITDSSLTKTGGGDAVTLRLANGSAVQLVNSELGFADHDEGTYHCVASYNSAFAPLNGDCQP